LSIKYRPLRETFSKVLYVGKRMSGRKKKKPELPVFDSIRKPTAPPSKKFGAPKPEEKARPAARKTKHKKSPATSD
jgi:hypothetical protein